VVSAAVHDHLDLLISPEGSAEVLVQVLLACGDQDDPSPRAVSGLAAYLNRKVQKARGGLLGKRSHELESFHAMNDRERHYMCLLSRGPAGGPTPPPLGAGLAAVNGSSDGDA